MNIEGLGTDANELLHQQILHEEIKNMDGLFSQLLKSDNNLFVQRDFLSSTHIPNALPHRQKEIVELSAILAPALLGEKPSAVLLYGLSGTGKTASALYVGNYLLKKARS